MNRKIGMYGSAVNFTAVLGFALSMLLDFPHDSYFLPVYFAQLTTVLFAGNVKKMEPLKTNVI